MTTSRVEKVNLESLNLDTTTTKETKASTDNQSEATSKQQETASTPKLTALRTPTPAPAVYPTLSNTKITAATGGFTVATQNMLFKIRSYAAILLAVALLLAAVLTIVALTVNPATLPILSAFVAAFVAQVIAANLLNATLIASTVVATAAALYLAPKVGRVMSSAAGSVAAFFSPSKDTDSETTLTLDEAQEPTSPNPI